MKKSLVLPIMLFTSIILSACGASTSAVSRNQAAMDMSYGENAMIEERASDVPVAKAMNAGANYGMETVVSEENLNTDIENADIQSERKLIRTVNMELKVESDISEAVNEIISLVEAQGGYIEQNSSYFGDYSQTVNLKLRVPKDGSDGLIDELKGKYKLLNIDDSVEDVTLNYTDIKTRLEVKTKTRDKYMEYLDKAESIEEILAIEEKISQVTAEIESYESQMRVMDNQIDYTTIYLNLQSDEKGVERGFWDKVKERFNNFSENVLKVIMSMIEWTVYALIVLIFVIPLVGLTVKILMRIIRGKNKKSKDIKSDKNDIEKQSVKDILENTKKDEKKDDKK
ncbi:MAG: DUF4349 domain-containing protein [Eubacteriales bacterium]|nr:DUF4349 domain-containing protein [Eubacteriales bacterium]